MRCQLKKKWKRVWRVGCNITLCRRRRISNILGNLCRCTGYRPILDGFRTFCCKSDNGNYACSKDDNTGVVEVCVSVRLFIHPCVCVSDFLHGAFIIHVILIRVLMHCLIQLSFSHWTQHRNQYFHQNWWWLISAHLTTALSLTHTDLNTTSTTTHQNRSDEMVSSKHITTATFN